MNHRKNARRGKRVILSLLATTCLAVGSPVVVANAASNGAQKPVSASFGDCKNDNAGKHKGFVCPKLVPVDEIDTGSGTDTGTGTDTGGGYGAS